MVAISEGLTSAHFVAVLITENFLERNWTPRELNAALSREIRTGSVVVIPVLAVDHDTYARMYPLLEDKVYLSWAEGAEALADRTAALFARAPASE